MKFCNKEQQGKQLAQTKHYEQGTNVSRSNIGNQTKPSTANLSIITFIRQLMLIEIFNGFKREKLAPINDS